MGVELTCSEPVCGLEEPSAVRGVFLGPFSFELSAGRRHFNERRCGFFDATRFDGAVCRLPTKLRFAPTLCNESRNAEEIYLHRGVCNAHGIGSRESAHAILSTSA